MASSRAGLIRVLLATTFEGFTAGAGVLAANNSRSNCASSISSADS
jgi:hypothetical protein